MKKAVEADSHITYRQVCKRFKLRFKRYVVITGEKGTPLLFMEYCAQPSSQPSQHYEPTPQSRSRPQHWSQW